MSSNVINTSLGGGLTVIYMYHMSSNVINTWWSYCYTYPIHCYCVESFEGCSATLNCICSRAMSASRLARLFLKSTSLVVVVLLLTSVVTEVREEVGFRGYSW